MDKLDARRERGMDAFRALAPDAVARLENGIGQLSPDLVAYAAEFPFGEIYERDGLEKRERQLITLACLATRGDAPQQLKIHFEIARALGIDREALVELVIQLIPYAGFPTALNAAGILLELLPEAQADAD